MSYTCYTYHANGQMHVNVNISEPAIKINKCNVITVY